MIFWGTSILGHLPQGHTNPKTDQKNLFFELVSEDFTCLSDPWGLVRPGVHRRRKQGWKRAKGAEGRQMGVSIAMGVYPFLAGWFL